VSRNLEDDRHTRLGVLLRTIANARGLTREKLQARVPGWDGAAVDAYLDGTQTPTWSAVAAFLKVIATGGQWHRELLERQVRPVWEATAKARAPGNDTGEAAADEVVVEVPPGTGNWITALRKVVSTGRAVSRVQVSISRHDRLETDLAKVLDQISQATTSLEAQLDGLREELAARRDSAPGQEPDREMRAELEGLRLELLDTQQRLDAAKRLQQETEQRLAESERQRQLAEQLRDVATAEAERARRRLAELEHDLASDPARVAAIPRLANDTASALMGDTDQQAGTEVLRRADEVLRTEGAALSQLSEDLTSTPAREPPAIGEAPRAPGARRVGHFVTRRRAVTAIGVGVGVAGLLTVISIFASASQVRWTYTTSGPLDSSPAVAGGTVYIGSHDDTVYALNAATGTRRWTYTTSGPVSSSPAVADGTVYIGSFDHKIYALDTATGTPRWTYTTSDLVDSSPVVADGTVYIGGSDRNVYALNAATGHPRWTYKTGGAIDSSPAVTDGTVYIGSSDHKIYALDTATGTPRWTHTTGGLIDSSPAVTDGTVYIGSSDHKIYALDTATGTPRWTHTTGNAVYSSPAVAHGTVYIGSDDGNVYALHAAARS